MGYKQRTPFKAVSEAKMAIRGVLTLQSQESLTTQNMRTPKKNTVGYQ